MSPVSPPPATPKSRASSASSQSAIGPRAVARKRIIYAHSDILTRRSEYFATMLNSSFSENAAEHAMPGERKVYTIVVEEVDFVTIYWLLKWVYANWVLFRKEDDPREAIDGIGAGWSARGFSSPGAPDEWEWKTFSKRVPTEGYPVIVSDSRSVTSAESARSNGGNGGAAASRSKENKNYMPGAPPNAPSMTMRSTSHTTSGPKVVPSASSSGKATLNPPPTPTRPARPSNASSNSASPSTPIAGPQRTAKPVSLTIPPVTHFPMSPHAPRGGGRPSASSADPHPHPIPEPPPASALSMYSVAHRYAMPGLAALALEHIMSTLTPQTSFAVLLATATWDELRSLVEVCISTIYIYISVSMVLCLNIVSWTGLCRGQMGRSLCLGRVRTMLRRGGEWRVRFLCHPLVTIPVS